MGHTMRKIKLVNRTFILVAGFLAGCSSSPTSPGEKALTVFVDRNYEGSWHDVFADWSNLKSVGGSCNQVTVVTGGTTTTSGGDWDDCISSIRLSPGWVAILYRDRNFSGPTLEITEDIPNLRNLPGPCDHGFDDCVSSIRVSKR